jgi:hypothetical protein
VSPHKVEQSLSRKSGDYTLVPGISSSASYEAWAGPAYVNSPPPSCLPVPGFIARNTVPKETSGLGCQDMSSTLSSPLKPERLFNDVPADVSPLREMSAQYVDRTHVEVSLKRILQVA